MIPSYKQPTKQLARHTMIRAAVELLTQKRQSTCCVPRDYVRNLYDYFSHLDESNEQREVKNIDLSYIRMWEKIHSHYIGSKSIEDLTVCYLSGPEPENDFAEFISMGILPHNIWAFESQKNTYLQALQALDSTSFFQPKLIKTSIENFFINTPKEFDIVYIDACSPLVSDQHALRCISTMFKYHRLASPGILISNFADVDSSNKQLREEYYDMIAKYYTIKEYPNIHFSLEDNSYFKRCYNNIYDSIKNNFDQYYGDFITATIFNAAAITVPTLRFIDSTFLTSFSSSKVRSNSLYTIDNLNAIQYNNLAKYFILNDILIQEQAQNPLLKRIQKLERDLSADWNNYTLAQSFQKILEIRGKNHSSQNNLQELFEMPNSMYQFLDKPTKKLFLDAVINQLSCPMHYCTDKVERLSYTAKNTRMYMDLIPFDECRYIYDWLPAIDQMKNAFSNKSWQYVFRFALDGLVKKRINYNNEFFFQGTVITQQTYPFNAATIKDRKEIYEGELLWP